MRKLFTSCLVATSLLVTGVQAIEIEVKYSEPDSYRDIDSGNEPKSKFKERVFKQLTKQFVESGSDVTFGHKMLIDVTNIDLAGDIDYFASPNHHAMRVVKPIYFPRISFKYRLEDDNGRVIRESEETLKDMGFMDRTISMRYERGGFKYEKRLIDNWFKSAFTDH